MRSVSGLARVRDTTILRERAAAILGRERTGLKRPLPASACPWCQIRVADFGCLGPLRRLAFSGFRRLSRKDVLYSRPPEIVRPAGDETRAAPRSQFLPRH